MKKISFEKLWQVDDEQEEDQPEVQERTNRQEPPEIDARNSSDSRTEEQNSNVSSSQGNI